MNQLQLMAQLLRGRNPEEIVMQYMQNTPINDPRITSLVQYAQSGNSTELVNLARQMFQQQGRNLDNEFSNFMNMLK